MAVVNLRQITKSANKGKIIEWNDNMNFNNFQEPFGIMKSTVHNRLSKINTTIVDFTRGSGDKAVVLKHNSDPNVIKAIASQVIANQKNIFTKGFREEKINFHKKDEKGYSTVSAMLIKYQENMNNPWAVEIVNGKGIAANNQNGGTVIKKNSFVETGRSIVYMSEMEFLIKMNDVKDYSEHFELVNMNKMLEVRNKLEQRIRNGAKMQVIEGKGRMEAEI